MGWGNTRPGPKNARLTWTNGELSTAAAMCAAQLPAAGLLWWFGASSGDDYGAGYGGAFGLLCVFVLAPLHLPVLGLLHAAAQTRPRAVRAVRRPGRG